MAALAAIIFLALEGIEKHAKQLPGTTVAVVTRVVDGDTVKVQLSNRQETVRYIGVDTPESVKPDTPVQCFAKQASSFNEHLVGGRRVRLVFGREQRDRYGRLLAYVYLVDSSKDFVNADLVKRGLARTLAIPPNTKFTQKFAALQSEAKETGRGLWSACGP